MRVRLVEGLSYSLRLDLLRVCLIVYKVRLVEGLSYSLRLDLLRV
jgi:hypothetical protein